MAKRLTVFIWLYVMTVQYSLALDGAESMDRPSARPLPIVPKKPDEEKNRLTLPPVPIIQNQLDNSETIHLQRVVIEGSTVFSAQELSALNKDYENRTVSIAEIEALRQKLTQFYIDHGYINSGAVIPEDALQDGELHKKPPSRRSR
jgi:hemolysin activation/secretion protein